ncbi:hypothetical protein D6C78_06740 [Aureobasidium pullulans]|uniref:Uncharacterized protein n=1 Tax=Aureobasidium pullulans TaxID=5580 RepID=A0A4T0BQY4_AURPU|nr:hypothetical protein D6C78_06740 [Aureobasidium pullulans]
MRSTSFYTGLAAISLGSGFASAQCQVYGIDFQSGGSYFQNSELTDPFTLVQEFSGCSNDTANNIFVDPNGDQYQCSDTPLTPDYEPETVTCSDWPKDKLYSGDWSMIVISNNGDADPIAFQRDFSLSVGTPTTITYTPTVTATDVETSVSSIISTISSTITTTLVPKTTTKRQLIAFAKPTLLSHPLSIQVVTKNLYTVTKTRYQPHVTQTTVEANPSCASPTPNWIADPIARIEVTIIKSVFQKLSNSAKFKRGISEDAEAKQNFVADRSARLQQAHGLEKRAPDASISTVTATNTAEYVTSTTTQWTTVTSTFPTTLLSTVYVLPLTHPLKLTNTRFSTSTPPTVTVTRALLDFAALQTLIQNVMHVTITDYEIATETQVKSVPWTVTVTSTTTPAVWAAQCTNGGGKIW